MASMLNEGIVITTPPSANHSMPASAIEEHEGGAQQKASTAAVVDDGWESVEVEEMGAVVAPAPPTIALNSTTSASSSSSQFGHLVSPPLHQLHPQLASNSILNNVAAPSKPSNGVGPQLSYLQIAGSLMTSSANSSSRSAVYSSNQATSSTPLVHPSSSSSPFAFVPKPVGKDHDSFKDAFEQARDKLHLFERRFGGDDGRETTTTAATAAQDGAGTPTKGEAKRKRGEGGSDSEKKRTEKKSKKGDEGGADEQQKKKKKKKKDKKSSSGKSKPKKEDGSASLALDEKPEGGFTFMQGAYFILKREHRFMTAKEIVAIGVAEDLFASSKGKTPEATVAAGIYVDLKKPISQFCQGCKVGKRGFGLSEWKDLESIPGPPDTPVKTRRRTTKSEEGAKKKQTSAASPSTSSRRTAKKREEEEEARRRRQALLEEEDAEEEEEEIEEEMVIVEEEEDEDEASGGDSTSTPPPNALRPLPFGSPLAF